jgi:hypothetical protein
MQLQPLAPSPTWVTFGIEAVKIIGPALLALGGSWLALRYQRKVKQIEIDGQLNLRARELIFESYQKRLEDQTRDLRELAKTLRRTAATMNSGTEDEKTEASALLGEALAGTLNPVLFNVERLEKELEDFDLLSNYKAYVALIKECGSGNQQDLESNEEKVALTHKFFTAVSYLSVINQDLLDTKREQLFRDYLPKPSRYPGASSNKK